MSVETAQADWYYVGHYGQLGPLTLAQMGELASDGVITPETYVWRSGMADWTHARNVPELKAHLGPEEAPVLPPARPVTPPPAPIAPRPSMGQMPVEPYVSHHVSSQSGWSYIQSHAPKSDKNRVVGGVLNFIPGVGRLYLGYMAHGVLQIFTAFCFGVGFLWSWIDAIYILSGGVRLDGYGRRLDD